MMELISFFFLDVSASREVRRVGVRIVTVEKCGIMLRKEHVCRYGTME